MEKMVRTKAQETFVKLCDEVQHAINGSGLDAEQLQSAANLIEALSKTGLLWDVDKKMTF